MSGKSFNKKLILLLQRHLIRMSVILTVQHFEIGIRKLRQGLITLLHSHSIPLKK